MKKIIVCGIVIVAIIFGGVSVIAFQKGNEGFFGKNLKLSDEQQQILTEKIKEDISEMLEAEEITKEQYDALSSRLDKGNFNLMRRDFKGDMNKKREIPKMTEEEKDKMKQSHIEKLKERLEKGEITQVQYEEMLEKAENGKFLPFARGKMPQMGEMPEKFKENFDKKIGSDGERPKHPMTRGFRGARGRDFGKKPAQE